MLTDAESDDFPQELAARIRGEISLELHSKCLRAGKYLTGCTNSTCGNLACLQLFVNRFTHEAKLYAAFRRDKKGDSFYSEAYHEQPYRR